jgi:hypothetical protein
MKKKPLGAAILAVAVVVFFALPGFAAAAGQVVPPGNSAATQYTQAFPTSGGNVAVGTSIGEPGGGGHKPPAKVIGKKTAQELESQGPEGQAVADLAAESAPTSGGSESESETSQGSGGAAGGNGSGGGHQGGAKPAGGSHPAGSNQGGAKAGGAGSQPTAPANNAGATAGTAAAEAAGSGSSGISEVVGQATGASSGQMGVFLPLVLLAALAFALAYAWRRRHEQKAAS